MYKQDNLLKERRQTVFVILCCLVISLSLQFFKFLIFPEKYFADADAVLGRIQGTQLFAWNDSYANTTIIFQWLNHWLPMDSQLYSGLSVWALIIVPTLLIAVRHIQATWEHYILLAAYTVLLPVFVWNIQKEAVQYVFFLVLAFVANIKKSECRETDILLVVLLLIWSMVFRNYYLIIAAGTAVLLVFTQCPLQHYSPNVKRRFLKGLTLAVLVGLLLLNFLSPEKIQQLFNGRMAVNEQRINDSNANTIILDIVQNPQHSLVLYLLNYLLAGLRMMFPVELIFKGVQYWPFVLMQLFWTSLLLRAIKTLMAGKWIDIPQKRLLCITICWYLVSFLFEPDFGSFVRHQAALFPLSFPVFLYALEANGENSIPTYDQNLWWS